MRKQLEKINRYKFGILLVIYLYIITFNPIGYSFNIELTISTLMIFGINFIIPRFSRVATISLNILYIFFISFSAIFSLVFKSWIWPESILNIFRTDPIEAKGMLAQFLIPSIIIIISSTTLTLLAQKELKLIPRKTAYCIGLICMSYIFIFVPLRTRHLLLKEHYTTIFKEPLRAVIYANERSPIITGNIFAFYGSYTELQNIKELIKQTSQKKEISGIIRTNQGLPNHLFIIIGESSNASHYPFYGYDKNITPFLDSINSKGEIFHYDAIAPFPTTLAALKRIFSFSSLASDKMAYTHKSIVELANENEYETLWISAQYQIGSDDLALASIYLNSDYKYFINEKGAKLILDENLIPLIKDKYNNDKKQVFFIHLIGSHINYSDKYDQSDMEYIKQFDYNNAEKYTIEYDCSIHHTDQVIKEIYKISQNSPSSLLVYFSDHGEIIGKGHGYDYNFKEQYEIPLLTVSQNRELLLTSDSIMKMLQDKSKNRINTINLSLFFSKTLGYDLSDSIIIEGIKKNDSIGLQSGYTLRYDDIKEK